MAKIHIERMMHRKSIAVLGESAATYALLKVIPSGGGAEAFVDTAVEIAAEIDVVEPAPVAEPGRDRPRSAR